MTKNIAVVGTGYVGLSLAVLLSQKHKVICLDIDNERVNLINQRRTFLKDREIKDFLENKKLNLKATTNKVEAYSNSEIIIIATPTDYDKKNNSFDTSTVESVISETIQINKNALIVIKSTVPIGFTDEIRLKYQYDNILFSPEFLRESKALYDNLYPSRIVVGGNREKGSEFANLLLDVAINDNKKIKILKMTSKEAESVKLFSNTYLAMRVAFFNELDSFGEVNQLDSKKIIHGVCADNRIGDYYNNPSYGYGGYCLPKDTQQLLSNYKEIPNNIIDAAVKANQTRKKFIVDSIIEKKPKVVGVYRLIMKNESDNFRDSAILDIIDMLLDAKIRLKLFEPLIKSNKFRGVDVIEDLSEFKDNSDLIIANRITKDLKSVMSKVYSRDIFGEN